MNLYWMIKNKYCMPAEADGAASGGADSGASTSSTSSTTESAGADSGDGSSSSSSSSSDFDFAALASHDEYGDDTGAGEGTPTEGVVAKPAPVVEAKPPGAPVAPAAPVQQPVAPTPPTVAKPVEQPAVQPQQAATQQQAPAPGSEQPKLTPEQAFQKHRETYLPRLQEQYQLSENEVELLRTDPGKFFPEMAAKLHYNVQMATHNALVGIFPQMMEKLMEQRTARDEANNAFYTQWPKLKEAVGTNPQTEETIRQSIKAYRAANPKADRSTVIKQAGLLAMMTLGLPIEAMGQGQQASAPAAPAAPAAAPTRPVRPAGAGAVGHMKPASPSSGNDESSIFEDLVNEFEKGNI